MDNIIKKDKKLVIEFELKDLSFVIESGIDRKYGETVKIDIKQFIDPLIDALMSEEEDGWTPVYDAIATAAYNAYENGEYGIRV